ncbi:MAG: Rrf2 family transcriptional regulator [Planctomycetes bacterium]|nr:Rrf2 family transcriptional regulator [Planctomycetota bacterium]
MKLSTRSRYAVRVLVELARRYGMGMTPLADIAGGQGLSPQYVDNILRRLRSAGFVELRRGAGGGCRLARDPALVSAWDIVREVEDFALAPCSPSVSSSPPCPRASECSARFLWDGLEQALRQHLSSVTLLDLTHKGRRTGPTPEHRFPFHI